MHACDANIMDMIDLITVNDMCVNYVTYVRSLGNNSLLRCVWSVGEAEASTIIE